MDPYKVLEIDKNASDSEIKKAYHKLARKYHPDRNNNDKESEEKFKEVNEAYFILMNGGSSNQAFGSDGFNPDIDLLHVKTLVETNTKIFNPLISHRISLDEVNHGFDLMRSGLARRIIIEF